MVINHKNIVVEKGDNLMADSMMAIDKAVLHILDTNIDQPVIADKLMEYNPETADFIRAHIVRCMDEGDAKKGWFLNDEEGERMKQALTNLTPESFLEVSSEIAGNIFEFTRANAGMPPSDVIMCHFQFDHGFYFGILKFNYKQSYMHSFHMEGDAKTTGIIKHNATIASENQKIDEFVFIRLDDFSVLMKEKKFEINGVKEFYLSDKIFHITTDMSAKAKVKIVEKAAERVIKEYYGEDPLKVSQLKTEIKSCVDESSIVEIDRISNAVFENNFAAKQKYKETVESKGIATRAFEVPQEIEKTVSRKQKLTTDSGIEISLPIDYMENQKKVEFIMNEDGTMSILIKSVVLK